MTERLTDAELDAIEAAFESYVSGSGELAWRAIAELRELRAKVDELNRLADDTASAWAGTLTENAKLRAAGEAWRKRHFNNGVDCDTCDALAAALATPTDATHAQVIGGRE